MIAPMTHHDNASVMTFVTCPVASDEMLAQASPVDPSSPCTPPPSRSSSMTAMSDSPMTPKTTMCSVASQPASPTKAKSQSEAKKQVQEPSAEQKKDHAKSYQSRRAAWLAQCRADLERQLARKTAAHEWGRNNRQILNDEYLDYLIEMERDEDRHEALKAKKAAGGITKTFRPIPVKRGAGMRFAKLVAVEVAYGFIKMLKKHTAQTEAESR